MRCMPPRYYANATVSSQPHFCGILLNISKQTIYIYIDSTISYLILIFPDYPTKNLEKPETISGYHPIDHKILRNMSIYITLRRC